MEYDVFICHASEDKKEFVKPLADALVEQNIKVWYDEFELALGDSLREKIDYGLANSTYGVVVLSKAFFEKKWPKEELDGLVSRQTSEGRKVILPVWHKVGYEDVKKFSPILAGKLAASSDQGIDAVVAQILDVCKQDPSPKKESVFQTTASSGLREKCLEIIRADKIVAWRELIERITEEIIEKLRISKQTIEQNVSNMLIGSYKQELHKKYVCEAINISIPGLVPILTAIQINNENNINNLNQ